MKSKNKLKKILTASKIKKQFMNYMDNLEAKNRRIDNRLIHGLFRKNFKASEEMKIRI